jgi:group II intron reverse transcriptase/maturase
MNGLEESDGPIVPGKPGNAVPSRGLGGGKGPGQGKHVEGDPHRTQDRGYDGKSSLRRVSEKVRKEAAEKDKDKQRFVNLFTHLRVDLLREVFFRLRKQAAPGVDGQTWAEYAEGLDDRLRDLQDRLHRGAYKPPPVRRVEIPKAGGKKRPLGLPTVEDKVVQGAVVALLTPVYEAEFLECSYGFRPKRNQHEALEAVDRMLYRGKVDWVLDADLRSYFDTIEHDRLVEVLGHRIGDQRLIRLIRRWLKAGVLTDQGLEATEEGTPQGGLVSPLLANIYLHYVLDLWARKEMRSLWGQAHLVRYADDFLVGFQRREDAETFRRRLDERLKAFGLTLHPEKTRLIRFGMFAQRDCAQDGLKRPQTFVFLGFTHICGRSREGKFKVVRRTASKKRRAKLAELKVEMRRRLHWRIGDQWSWLCSVLRGHYRYYGVSTNFSAISSFRYRVWLMWHRSLQRRSQRAKMTRAKLDRIDARFPLPRPKIRMWQLHLALSP